MAASDRADTPRTAVFIGGSAGGIEALAELVSRLPRDLGAPVLVVLHVGRAGRNVLPSILDRLGSLHAVTPEDGEALAPGIVYVAPRDQHMLVQEGRIRLDRGPTEHGLRPAIDPLFRSAARTYGPHAIGVILSGMLDDGTAGLREVRASGGWAIVQHPEEAAFSSMPSSAVAGVDVDYVLPVAEIAERIVELIDRQPRRELQPQPREPQFGEPPPWMQTDITCPLCGGVLWEKVEGDVTSYHCRAGHAYTAESLLTQQDEGLGTAIWRPIRMLQERGALLRRLADRADQQGRQRSRTFFAEQADDALRRAAEMQAALKVSPSASRDGDEPTGTSDKTTGAEPR